MGFFDFLKRAKKEEKVEEIRFNEFGNWIDSKLNKALEDVSSELEGIKTKIEDEKAQMIENIGKLQNAELKNKDVPERIKQIMEGNRGAYIYKVKTFIGEISVPKNFDKILEFCDSFDKYLDEFEKNVAKSHHVMLEFFVKEATAVSTGVKNLDKLRKDMKNIIENSEVKKLTGLKDEFNEAERRIKQKEEGGKGVEELRKEFDKFKKEINNKEREIKNIESGKEFKDAVELIGKGDGLKQELENLKRQMSDSFSSIETALKKYGKVDPEDKLVEKYLSNSIDALVSDEDLKIISLVEKIKDCIGKGELELKDKKKDKTLVELEKLDKNYFEDFLGKHGELNDELIRLQEEIEKIDIIEKVEKMRSSLEKDKIKLDKDKEKIDKMVGELNRIDVERLKDLLRENAAEVVKIVK